MYEPITAAEMRRSFWNSALNKRRADIWMSDPGQPALKIIAEVAEEHGVSVAALLGPCKVRELAVPRMLAYHRIRAELGYSYPRIGRIFKRDHSTIIYGVRRVREWQAAQVGAA